MADFKEFERGVRATIDWLFQRAKFVGDDQGGYKAYLDDAAIRNLESVIKGEGFSNLFLYEQEKENQNDAPTESAENQL